MPNERIPVPILPLATVYYKLWFNDGTSVIARWVYGGDDDHWEDKDGNQYRPSDEGKPRPITYEKVV
jgi:hypothetical protein